MIRMKEIAVIVAALVVLFAPLFWVLRGTQRQDSTPPQAIERIFL